jgi:hypothetical protein
VSSDGSEHLSHLILVTLGEPTHFLPSHWESSAFPLAHPSHSSVAKVFPVPTALVLLSPNLSHSVFPRRMERQGVGRVLRTVLEDAQVAVSEFCDHEQVPSLLKSSAFLNFPINGIISNIPGFTTAGWSPDCADTCSHQSFTMKWGGVSIA